MKSLSIIIVAALSLIVPSVASAEKATEQPPEHPVAVVRCEPLPPAGNAEVAKVLKDKLVVPGACPAGQYPSRYGSGKDLSKVETCVDNTLYREHYLPSGERFSGPITDPNIAKSVAERLSEVARCPPGTHWEMIPDPTMMPPSKGPIPRDHIEDLKSPLKSDNPSYRQENGILRPNSTATDLGCTLQPSDKLYHCHQATLQVTPSNPVSGVSGQISVQKPFIPLISPQGSTSPNGTSLGQILAKSPDGSATIEMGWMVTPNTNINPKGDLIPRLFVYYSVNSYANAFYNNAKNPNGKGFISRSSKISPGDELNVGGTSPIFKILYSNSGDIGWQLFLNDQYLGYYSTADNLFSYTTGSQSVTVDFTQATDIEWYGEISSRFQTITTAMGNGILGTSAGSSSIDAIMYYDSSGKPHSAQLTGKTREGLPYYGLSNVTSNSTSFTYGGPGWSSNTAYVPNYDPNAAVLNGQLMQIEMTGGRKSVASQFSFDAGGVAAAPDGSAVYVVSPVPNGGISVWPRGQSGQNGTLGDPTFYPINFGTTPTKECLLCGPSGVAISPDGGTVYLTAGTTCIYQFDTSSQKSPCLSLPSGASGKADQVAVSEVGTEQTLFVSTSSLVYFYHFGEAFHPLNKIPGPVSSIVVSPDQAHLYVAGQNGTLYVVDLNALNFSNNPDNYIPQTYSIGTPIAAAVSPDSRRVYVVTSNVYPFPGLSNEELLTPVSSSVLVFDASGFERSPNASLTALGPIGLPAGPLPVGASMSADGSTLYVATTCFQVAGCGKSGATVDQISILSNQNNVAVAKLPYVAPAGNPLDHTTGTYLVPTGNFAGGR